MQIKKNEMRGSCNMQGKLGIAYEVNSDNLQRRNQLVDLPLDDKKKGWKPLTAPAQGIFDCVIWNFAVYLTMLSVNQIK